MSDQSAPPPAAPPKKRPPAGGPQRPRPRPVATTSPESRFIGYLVLGFGVLAVIAVLILAFGNDDVPSKPEAAKIEQAAPANAKDLMADLSAAPQPTKPAPKVDLFFERDPDFAAGKMEGDWQGAIGRYTAVLQIREGVYQLILASTDPVAPRYYSSGTYKVVEDIIMMTPRMDWPAPASVGGKIIAYEKLTRAPFPVIARFEGGNMLWQNIPQAEKRVTGPYTSPLFMSEDVKLATWKRLK